MRTLYKPGNRGEAWGIKFDYAEFDDEQVDAAMADGWVKNPLDLKQQKSKPEKQADGVGDGKLSVDEAKEYLDSISVDYAGLHWKKVVALAELHQKG